MCIQIHINKKSEVIIRRLEGLVRKAIQHFDMIKDGDRVAVGVSGGKDSVALVGALAALRRYCGIDFSMVALTLDPCFEGKITDYSPITEYFKSINVEHHVQRTDIGNIVFVERKERHPCSLCAVLRRGALHDFALENGCNKIALGHHLDDAIETFYMNLFTEGRIGCFSPVSYLSRKDLHMIRPMLFAAEKDVISAVKKGNLPIVKSTCPVDGTTNRQKMKDFVRERVAQDPAFRQKMLGAFLKSEMQGWGLK